MLTRRFPWRAFVAAAVFASLAVAAGSPARAAAPTYLICELQSGEQWMLVIENFGGMHGARAHCIQDLNGRPVGVVR